ncbi:Crp/Fnr family transcriptional regulator [Sphingosinicella rhizophila]|uniref:Helix-turn-helix domain-containing protein n=1 Tax=Sphingosinicella rhizophila TaxID=3050082 RepID=A0ABU3Q854_9SPHN|nr:helix-turn-helix domain-containing protein [Sphingosinicella sp. GR2756]MDT9599587.1 helix-turn-helix domain-containing protein [Sphingosinicella sp. GR2756]
MANRCGGCAARLRGICNELAADQLALLSTLGRQRCLAAGETLIWEGEDAAVVANLLSGALKLTASTASGREQILGIAYPSDFVGPLYGRRSGYSVTALSDVEICLFTRRDFEGFARHHPALEHELLKRALTDLDRARRFMLLLGRKSAIERVASLILELSERLGTGGQLELPLGRQQMADVLGLTIETVSRQLTLLKSAGIIALPGRRALVINGRADLEALSEAA